MSTENVKQDALGWLNGGGDAGALVRAFDWATTPLGPVASWPTSLRTTVGTLLHSRHPMFMWWGPELIQIYNDGYTPSFGAGKHPRAMGQRGRDCWREIWPIIGPQIEDVMTRGISSWNEDELVPIARNGRIEEVYWTYGYSPVFEDGGAIGGTLVVCTETTARVLAERRATSSRALATRLEPAMSFEAALHAAAAVFTEVTADAPFVAVYLRDRETGKLARAYAPLAEGAEMRQNALDALDALIQRTPVADWPNVSRDLFIAPMSEGPSAPVIGLIAYRLSARLPFDRSYREYLVQMTAHVGVAFARIETQRAREATARERNNLLMTAPVATALFRGKTHVFELTNDRYCQMVGRRDLVGKTYKEAFPELVDTSLPGTLDHVYETGEPFVSGELLVPLDRHGNGVIEDRFFRFNLEAMRDEVSRIYGMMAVAVDITDQVVARRSLESTQHERERLVADLEAASRTKDEFLAMLGHELRNPLSPIVTALHIMRLREEGGSHEREIIERQVGHLVRLVDDLLDISKITRGKIGLRKEPTDVSAAIAKAIEMASDLFEERRHRLVITPAEPGLYVDADPVRLAQVFANVLTNAARYTDPHGQVTVQARRVDDHVNVTVADNGVGISADLLPNVFDAFVQGQRSADRKEGGLGLGLALVRSLVTMHGGTVVMRSEGEGKGSEIEVSLPALATVEAITGKLPKNRAPITNARARRIFVVDDNTDSAEMLSIMLEAAGHEVEIAHDGPAALARIASFKPDVALLDIGLPVMDGYELGKRIHELPETAHCRLVALTGYGQDSDHARSKAAGFAAHLVKPVDLDRLLEVVARAP